MNPIRRRPSYLAAALVLAACGCGGSGKTAALPLVLDLSATADAFICSDDQAADNFGFEEFSVRSVGRQNAFTGQQIGRQLYRFDLPSELSLTTVSSAFLTLYEFDNFAGFPMTTSVFGSFDTWTESTVTFDNQPALDGVELDAQSIDCCGDVAYFNVTDYVNAQLAAGDTVISLSQRSSDESTIGGVRWFMREGDAFTINGIVGTSPRLTITR